MVKLELIEEQHVIADPPTKELLAAFGMVTTYPKNTKFATQNEGENVVIVLRKHFIKNIGWIFNAVLIFLGPTILLALVMFLDATLAQNAVMQSDIIMNLNPNIITAMLLFYYSLGFSFTLLNFIHWYYDLFIISNERFISIDFDVSKGMTITDIPLNDIIDISETTIGLGSNLFGFGNIEFKTTSEKKMLMEMMAQPTWFRDSFADLIKFIRSKNREDTGDISERKLGESLPEVRVEVTGDTDTPEAEVVAVASSEPKSKKVSVEKQIKRNLEP